MSSRANDTCVRSMGAMLLILIAFLYSNTMATADDAGDTSEVLVPIPDTIDTSYTISMDTVAYPIHMVKDGRIITRLPVSRIWGTLSARVKAGITLRGRVSKAGTLDTVYIMETSGFPWLDSAAITAARASAFVPANDIKGEKTSALIEWEVATGPAIALVNPPSGSEESSYIEQWPEPDEFVEVEELPEVIHSEKPKYPRMAKEVDLSGSVWVQALVGKDGSVMDARVGKSSGTVSLDEAAVTAAWKYKYKPAIQYGRPVLCWVTYEVKFHSGKN